MKKIIRILSIIIAITTCCIVLGGCNNMNGAFYTLNELYENQTLSRENIMNIAALRAGKVQLVKSETEGKLELEDFEFTATEPEAPLDDATAKKIIHDFKVKQKKDNNYNLSSCEIKKYFGTYNGYEIIEINFKVSKIDFSDDVIPIIVSDIYLNHIGRTSTLIAWTIEK